jgi:hypothetical protein
MAVLQSLTIYASKLIPSTRIKDLICDTISTYRDVTNVLDLCFSNNKLSPRS